MSTRLFSILQYYYELVFIVALSAGIVRHRFADRSWEARWVESPGHRRWAAAVTAVATYSQLFPLLGHQATFTPRGVYAVTDSGAVVRRAGGLP